MKYLCNKNLKFNRTWKQSISTTIAENIRVRVLLKQENKRILLRFVNSDITNLYYVKIFNSNPCFRPAFLLTILLTSAVPQRPLSTCRCISNSKFDGKCSVEN